MITRIARKELLELVRDGRFRWSGATIALLLLVALAAGWTHYRSTRAQHDAAQDAARRHWVTQGEKNPHSAAHYGIYAFKPRLPLSFVDRGVDPYTGTSVWLEAHRQNEFLMRPAQDATAAQRFGNLTAAGVLQLLVPLLIILLAFGALAAEREQGTLRQLLTMGISRRDLMVGKALGVSAALALLLVPAAAIGAVALMLGSAGAVMPTAARTASLFGVYVMYFGIFVGVTLAVSARAASSRTALIALLGFWIVNGLVAPRLAVDVSKRLHPAPSAFEFAQRMQYELKHGADGLAPVDAAALERQLLADYGVDSLDDLPVNFDGIRMQEGEEFGNRIFDRNYHALWDTFGRQSRVHEAGALAAPLLAVRSLSMALSGTDFAQHRHFATAAEEYRRRLVEVMNHDMTVNSRTGDWEYRANAALWETIPPLAYEAPGLAWVVANQKLSLALLFAWLVGSGVAALVSARRVRVD